MTLRNNNIDVNIDEQTKETKNSFIIEVFKL